MFAADFPILPLFPSLIALGVMGFSLFLAGTAWSTTRFPGVKGATTVRESAQIALFACGSLIAQLPLALPALPPYLGETGWALAILSALLLPRSTLPRAWRMLPLLAGIWLLLAVALSTSATLPLLVAAASFLPPARAVRDFHRHLHLGMSLLLLAGAAATQWNHALPTALQIVPLGAMILLLWAHTGMSRRSLVSLALALLAFPIVLALAGQQVIQQEQQFRNEQRNEAHQRLELLKNRLESLDAHGQALLKILATDQVTQNVLRNPGLDHDVSFRLLARRIGAEAVFLLDPTGHPLAASDPALKGRMLSHLPYFQQSLRGISNVYYLQGAGPNQAGVYYARPLLDETTQMAGVIVARFDLEENIGDSVRLDDVIMHRHGIVLIGPGELGHGVLFAQTEKDSAPLAEDLAGVGQLPPLGFRKIDPLWVSDRDGKPWMWASIPLPGGTWELSKLVSRAPLLDFRNERVLLLMLILAVFLVLGLHVLQNATFVHLLLREVEQRRQAEAKEREAREEIEVSNGELTQHRHHLESLVAERTQALDELNRTLDQRVRDEISKRKEQEQLLIHQSRLAAMGEMIGAIAHQWRQPLNALSLVLQNISLQFQMGRLDLASMTRLRDKGEAMVMQMSSTIDDFRNFFKPNKHADFFNLHDALRSASDILEGVLRNHSIRLEIDCAPDIQIYGYGGEFNQVVLNILSNAKDALISARQTDGWIRVTAAQTAGDIEIRFEDNGGGMDETTLHKIFEPYFTTKEEGKGTGLGLYMSKAIIENSMGGTLTARNRIGGACFVVAMPIREHREQAVPVLSPRSDRPETAAPPPQDPPDH